MSLIAKYSHYVFQLACLNKKQPKSQYVCNDINREKQQIFTCEELQQETIWLLDLINANEMIIKIAVSFLPVD